MTASHVMRLATCQYRPIRRLEDTMKGDTRDTVLQPEAMSVGLHLKVRQ
jgi:hypothetical protein